MTRYIDADEFVKRVIQYPRQSTKTIGLALADTPTADVVSKERYDILLEHANILAEEMRKYQNADIPERNVEKLTDREQRIFLAAMGKEEKVCRNVDKEFETTYEDSLVLVCREIERKVKKALWTN